jgi:uncharacterized protein (TIGR01777 family)
MEVFDKPYSVGTENKPAVLITGGTGLVGQQLCRKLAEKGYRVSTLSKSRKKIQGIESYYWNAATGEIDTEAIEKADYIIHLAGANIGEKRWSAKRKKEIASSRIQSALLLFNVFKEKPSRLKAFITASATGYYGSLTSKKVFIEDDLPSDDFLGKVCEEWESGANLFGESGVRTVKIRTGVVLDRKGGMISKLKPVVNLGMGAALGSGRQFVPWIHIDDLCEIYLKAIEDSSMAGACNAVAPEPITNKVLLKTMAKILHRPFWLPNIPAFLLRLVLGEMSVLVLTGNRVSSDKILKAGFKFQYPQLEPALRHILS